MLLVVVGVSGWGQQWSCFPHASEGSYTLRRGRKEEGTVNRQKRALAQAEPKTLLL